MRVITYRYLSLLFIRQFLSMDTSSFVPAADRNACHYLSLFIVTFHPAVPLYGYELLRAGG